MTEKDASNRLLTKESVYLNKYTDIKTLYAAVIKNPNAQKIDDYIIEIGYDDIKSEYDPISIKKFDTLKLISENENFRKDIENGEIIFNKVNTVSYQTDPREDIYGESIKKYDNLTGGISVFDINFNNSSGTAGAFFKIMGSEDIYLISNKHVLCGDVASEGDIIVHPSRSHTKEYERIGEIFWWKFAERSQMDVAIAKINHPVNIGNYTRCKFIKIKGIDKPLIGDNVRKCGRTTGLTSGEIRSINCTVYLNDGSEIYRNQILTSKMTEDGDSGSILINNDDMAVGLLFSGDEANVSFANNLMHIFQIVKKDIPNFIFRKFV